MGGFAWVFLGVRRGVGCCGMVRRVGRTWADPRTRGGTPPHSVLETLRLCSGRTESSAPRGWIAPRLLGGRLLSGLTEGEEGRRWKVRDCFAGRRLCLRRGRGPRRACAFPTRFGTEGGSRGWCGCSPSSVGARPRRGRGASTLCRGGRGRLWA